MNGSSSINQLATNESLNKLDQRHEELLVKLDCLYRELEAALASLGVKTDDGQRQEAGVKS